MNLDEIKSKFRHKVKADIKDLDLVLSAAPLLVREVDRLEKELSESRKRIDHLALLMKKRPPLSKEGKRGFAAWKVTVNEETNRLYLRLAGKFDFRSAKTASNHIISVFPNLREGFDVINDISEISPKTGKKVFFHLKKIMFTMDEIGVARIVNVTSENTPRNLTILFRAALEKGELGDSNVGSVKEAETLLANISRFLKA